MKREIIISILCLCMVNMIKAEPISRLLERIDKGASRKFKTEIVKDTCDFFELDQDGKRVVVRGNNYISIATGINWYLKYYAGIHLCWNQMTVRLPEILPPVKQKERRTTRMKYRYDLNYCTYSYSLAFWDWERWEKELDWMALHGINLPLSVTGMEVVWYNVLDKLGYSKAEINEFIAGSGFLAWWHMNNLEGWGGPNPDSWYRQQKELQLKILNRMMEYGMEPVFPGYSGMIPANAAQKLGLKVADPGKWCGFSRPAFLQPTDPSFERIAALYYSELKRLYGNAKFYNMDPFHEGGSTKGVDLAATGQAIMKVMKQANPEAVWVIQAWQANPRPEMIRGLNAGDMLVLDLSSENRPMWGDPDSPWYREKGYEQHDWVYCMLLNFGGNVGLYGRMDKVINGYYAALNHPNGKTLRGVGMTPEGIENNPVMYELLLELPWRAEKFTKEEWVENYAKARYGREDPLLTKAWTILANTVYNCPRVQEGTSESVFCARPAEDIGSVSSWGTSFRYYQPEDVRKAAECMLSVADKYRGNANFEYDLIDIVRQVLADKGSILQKEVTDAYRAGRKEEFKKLSRKFLDLILAQDRLLSTVPSFMLGSWLERSKKIAAGETERQLYEWNARTQITVWGNRNAANNGGLRDYSHREWSGLLKDFYYPRWEKWFNILQGRLEGKDIASPDWFEMEEKWTHQQNVYPFVPQGDPIKIAKEIYNIAFNGI